MREDDPSYRLSTAIEAAEYLVTLPSRDYCVYKRRRNGRPAITFDSRAWWSESAPHRRDFDTFLEVDDEMHRYTTRVGGIRIKKHDGGVEVLDDYDKHEQLAALSRTYRNIETSGKREVFTKIKRSLANTAAGAMAGMGALASTGELDSPLTLSGAASATVGVFAGGVKQHRQRKNRKQQILNASHSLEVASRGSSFSWRNTEPKPVYHLDPNVTPPPSLFSEIRGTVHEIVNHKFASAEFIQQKIYPILHNMTELAAIINSSREQYYECRESVESLGENDEINQRIYKKLEAIKMAFSDYQRLLEELRLLREQLDFNKVTEETRASLMQDHLAFGGLAALHQEYTHHPHAVTVKELCDFAFTQVVACGQRNEIEVNRIVKKVLVAIREIQSSVKSHSQLHAAKVLLIEKVPELSVSDS